MNNNAMVISGGVIKKLQLAETLLLLAASVALQFVLHLIPPVNGIPLGQLLLPAFFAPVIALFLFRPHVVFITAVFAPVVNYLVTGFPKPEMLATLTVELALFAAIAILFNHSGKIKEYTALTSYIAAKILAAVIVPFFTAASFMPELFIRSLVMSVPGLVILFALNKMLLKYKG
jgi:hypothetical protein